MESTEKRITKIESIVFTTNGNKGLAERFAEFITRWWKWHDHERKQTCYFLEHQRKEEKSKGEIMERKKFSLAKALFVAKDIGTLIALAALILNIIGVI